MFGTTGSLLAVSGLPYFSRCWRSDPELGLLVAGDTIYDPLTGRSLARALVALQSYLAVAV